MVPTVETKEISLPFPPPPNRQYPKKTPHTSCIAATEKLDRNLKMAHIWAETCSCIPTVLLSEI